MSVNDALCCGAEPLFFLDYVAMSHDDSDLLEQIVQGVSDGCMQADCASLGGETAIMPDIYARGDYDLAGFCVGVVERKRLITGAAISAGDVVLGLASSGFHSNGYSLVRRVVFDMARLTVEQSVPDIDGQTVGDVLLSPTCIYAQPLRRVLNYYKVKNVVHGIAHITGGGLRENLQRIVPRNVQLRIRRDSWQVPAVFDWVQRLGGIEDVEMERVFNMGIGLALVVSAHYADNIARMLQDAGQVVSYIGDVVNGDGQVRWHETNGAHD
jgi:phosphoribosylformylglycinamidine cyclo-ligase